MKTMTKEKLILCQHYLYSRLYFTIYFQVKKIKKKNSRTKKSECAGDGNLILPVGYRLEWRIGDKVCAYKLRFNIFNINR